VCQSGDDSIPTLKRLEMGNVSSGTFTIVPLVEGIEQLKIDYGIDTTSGDGLPDVYGDPSAYPDASCDDACKVANWQNTLTARVYVLARNLDPTPRYTDSKTYQLGSVTFGAYNDNYRRHVYSTLVRMMNPAGKRDVP
jgi:type IV pilus assembly protein PilW